MVLRTSLIIYIARKIVLQECGNDLQPLDRMVSEPEVSNKQMLEFPT